MSVYTESVTSEEAIAILRQIDSNRLIDHAESIKVQRVIRFIEDQERALNTKHDALTALVRKITTLRGQKGDAAVSTRDSEI